ncbi:MAG TPA: Smr/MutS family protein [Polyangiaceae bacterium]|jgi:DNA-nicking Smr family endonuclease|nr:Smr/MutS family protein [Polyangiaceae bacterium]
MSGKKKKKPEGPFAALQSLKDDLEKREKEAATAGKRAPAPPPRPSPATPQAPEDDAMTMHRLFAGVEPLDRSRGRLPKQTLEPSPNAAVLVKQARDAREREAEAVHDHLRTLVEGTARFEVEDDGVRVEGRRVDLPFDAVRRLRRGLLPIDARLDLHGMTVPQARTQLELFLRTTRARGERCVLVIHGKGEHSPRGAGVLRGEISAWLSQSATSEHVAAFVTAKGNDGGEGAVYVLLRR